MVNFPKSYLEYRSDSLPSASIHISTFYPFLAIIFFWCSSVSDVGRNIFHIQITIYDHHWPFWWDIILEACGVAGPRLWTEQIVLRSVYELIIIHALPFWMELFIYLAECVTQERYFHSYFIIRYIPTFLQCTWVLLESYC